MDHSHSCCTLAFDINMEVRHNRSMASPHSQSELGSESLCGREECGAGGSGLGGAVVDRLQTTLDSHDCSLVVTCANSFARLRSLETFKVARRKSIPLARWIWGKVSAWNSVAGRKFTWNPYYAPMRP